MKSCDNAGIASQNGGAQLLNQRVWETEMHKPPLNRGSPLQQVNPLPNIIYRSPTYRNDTATEMVLAVETMRPVIGGGSHMGCGIMLYINDKEVISHFNHNPRYPSCSITAPIPKHAEYAIGCGSYTVYDYRCKILKWSEYKVP